MIKYPLNFEFI